MEEEIDLREYIEVLIRHWKWIAALAIVAAVAALVVSFLLPPTYEASALVIITKPRYVMRFDDKFETVNNVQQPYKAYPALAKSDDLLLQTMAAINPPLPEEEQGLASFRERLEAVSGSDPSVVELRAKHQDAEMAARMVNTWADVFVSGVNELYDASAQDSRFFEEQLVDADAALAKAEQSLIEFQSRNQAAILEAQLASALQDLQDYIAEQREIERVIRNARALQVRMASQTADAQVNLGDELVALLLEMQAFSTRASRSVQTSPYDWRERTGEGNLQASGNLPPIQLQVSDAAFLSSGRTVGELATFLDGLAMTLEARQEEIGMRVASLEPQILALQQQFEEVETEKDRLTRAQDVARDTHITLARKVDEARIAAQDESGEVRLASYAAVPTDPVSPKKKLNTAVAGALGLFVGVFGAFVVEYWRQERPVTQPPEGE